MSAEAGYTKNCIERLSHDFHHEDAFQFVRNEWEPVITQMMKGVRPLTHTEFEALKDLFHGLSFTAIFKDERKVDFHSNDQALNHLRQLLFESEIVEVQYFPEARAAMGFVLQASCKALGRGGCEAYDQYLGLASPAVRPFSSREEQAIKWSTIHMIPPKQVMRTYHQEWSASKAKRQINRAQKHHLVLSAYLLARTFGTKDGGELFDKFTKDFIEAGYERLFGLAGARLPH